MMAKQKLFQTAVLLHPTEEEAKKGVKSQIIVDLKTILATDEKTAAMTANFSIPEEHRDKLEQIEVLVVNF